MRRGELGEFGEESQETKVLMELVAGGKINNRDCISLKGSEGKMEDRRSNGSRELSVKRGPLMKGALKNKENWVNENVKEIDDKVLRIITGGNAHRSIQEKSQLIEMQKQEIDELKQCLGEIKGNRKYQLNEGERVKL